MRRSLPIGISLSLLLATLAAPAWAREEGATASSLALSDSVRSSAVGPSALFFNPAAMHQFTQYTVETGYQFVAPIDGHVFTAGLVDSATNQAIAAGFAYSYVTGSELSSDLNRSGHLIRGGLASGYRGKKWAVHGGVGIRYIDLEVGDGGEATGFTVDVGALFVFDNMFRVAVVGHNLIETNLAETPRRMGVGTSILISHFLASFDAVIDFETSEKTEAQLNGGLEYAIGGQVPLRVGYQYDRITDSQFISGGIGYVSRVVAADFGFRQNLNSGTDNIFSLSVRVFVP